MDHVPVMVEEVLRYLSVRDGVYLDCTAGAGGHLSAISDRIRDGIVVAVDQDSEAVEYLMGRFDDPKVVIKKENFKNILKFSKELGIEHYDGILFDLGVSLDQLKAPRRGFSFDLDGDLDMRMDQGRSRSALDLIEGSKEHKLFEIIRDYGEDPRAKMLAGLIYRNRKGIKRTRDLRNLIERNTPYRFRKKTLHRVFQAFRIAVNDELENLKVGLDEAYQLLMSGGRLVCISYHSLEDRIVKNRFRNWTDFKVLTKKVIRPAVDEVTRNPRSRSARLRAGVKR